LAGVALNLVGVALNLAGVVLTLVGLVLSLAGVAFSLAGLVLSLAGVALSFVGLVLSLAGVVLSLAGVATLLVGLGVFLTGLTFSCVFRREGGVHVFRLLVARGGGSISCLLFLRAKGLLKKPRFFATEPSSGGVGSAGGDGGISCGTGLLGDAGLGASILDNEVGFEYSLCESRLAGRTGLGIELRSDGGPMRQNCVIPSAG